MVCSLRLLCRQRSGLGSTACCHQRVASEAVRGFGYGDAAFTGACVHRSPIAREEMARVKAAGGWLGDGRVCDVLAVSRAFGDWEFKSGNTDTLLKEGVEFEWWDQAFADRQNINGDLVIATPAVSETEVSEAAGDEFIVVATDGLWCAL